MTMDLTELINGVNDEGLYHSTLPWHLVYLDDHSNEALRDRLYELDPCLTMFDRFEICEQYLNSIKESTNVTKPILFVTINRMGRRFVPEIHSNDQIKSFHIFISSDSNNDQKIKWTTKYDKIKCVSKDLNQFMEYIQQDVAVLTHTIIRNDQNVDTTSTTPTIPVVSKARRRNIENYIVCWLDSNIDKTNNDYQYSITKLREVVNTVESFTEPNACVDFLTDMGVNVCLIISSTFGQHILPLIHDISYLNSIYIFCGVNKSMYEDWAKQYSKIKGVFTQIEPICERLKQDVHQSNQNSIAISFVAASDPYVNVHLDKLDPSFMYTQLLKEIVFEMPYDATALEEFINFFRELFVDNDSLLRQIDEFERNYQSHTPIWWYTSAYYIYSILNKALIILEIEIIWKMGFFIRDLHRHIEQLHTEQFIHKKMEPFTVYRGQGLLVTNFEQLQNTQGGIMSFNSFLSTSRERDVSLAFAESNQSTPDTIGILFRMHIDPSISSTPFASVREVSYYESEEEILFSMHTVFRIGDIKMIDKNHRLFQVDLTLTGDNDRDLQVLTERLREETEGSTGLQRLGALMLEMGQYDKALEVYETLLKTAHSNKDLRGSSSVYNQLGAIYSKKGDFDQALAHYTESLKIKLTELPPNDPSLATIYSNIGANLRNQNQLTAALEYMERALNTELKAPQSNPMKIASYRNNIGLVLTDQNRYSEALMYYEQALEIQQKHLPPNHPHLATSYNNIGIIYNELQEYSKALSYYEKSLAIMQGSLPPNHPDLAISYNNLGSIYNELQEYSKALSYYEKSVEIMQKSLPPNHPSLGLGYHNLAVLYYRICSYEAALQYIEKAIDICRRVMKPNDPQLLACQETLNEIREKL